MSAKRPGAHEPRLKSHRIRHDASDYDSDSLIEKEYRPDQEAGAREGIARERPDPRERIRTALKASPCMAASRHKAARIITET